MKLHGSHFLLRQLRPSDRDELAVLADNRTIWRNLRDIFPHPYSIEDADFYISLILQEETQYSFAIEVNGRFAGMIGLVPLTDVYRGTADIGYWLGEPYWGQGIMTEAVSLVTRYAFEVLDFKRLHAGIFDYNKGSMRVLSKCGFQKECICKDAITKDGQLWDEHRYALTQKEYGLIINH